MNCGFTDVEKYEHEYKWIIKNFNENLQWYIEQKQDTWFNSPTFSTGTHKIYQWHLQMYFGKQHEDVVTYSQSRSSMRLRVICESDDFRQRINLRTEFFILNSHGQKIELVRNDLRRLFHPPCDAAISCDFSREQLLQNAELLLPNDQLTIICEMYIRAEIFVNTLSHDVVKIVKEGRNNDIYQYFDDENAYFVTFVVGEKKMRAHTKLLMSRSEVFRRMYKARVDRNEKHIATDVANVSSEVFYEVLRFCYTSDLPNLTHYMAANLLMAAVEFGLSDLKELCEQYLCKNIDIENAAENFTLAHYHNGKKLMEHSRKFITEKILKVYKTIGFLNMVKDHPQLSSSNFPLDALRKLDPEFMEKTSKSKSSGKI